MELTLTSDSIEKWYDIYQGKTASLLEASCEIGAIIAGITNSTELCKAKKYGYCLGIGYQLADDLQDKDGIFYLTTENEIIETLKSYVNYIFIDEENGENQQAIFLNSLIKKALLRNN